MLRCKTEALQDPKELKAFCELVQRENVRSYLEIGSRWGGSLWQVMTKLPKGSRAVAVDVLPNQDLFDCVNNLTSKGYDVQLIAGDSTHADVIEAARKQSPFDLCLIDANHTELYVRKDWANYGPMADIVAFHDIAWDNGNRIRRGKIPIDVPMVWNEIKNEYRFEEIKLCHTRQDNGFGILWRS